MQEQIEVRLVTQLQNGAYLVNWEISDPSDVGSYILKSRLTICSPNVFAKILSKTCKTLFWINMVQSRFYQVLAAVTPF